MIHSLELPIQAQDLVKAYEYSIQLRDQTAQMVAEALIYRVIYLFGPPRQIICDKATEFS